MSCTCRGLLHPSIARALAVPHHRSCPARTPAVAANCPGGDGYQACNGSGSCRDCDPCARAKPRRLPEPVVAQALRAGALALVASLQRSTANRPRAQQERVLATLPAPECSPVRRLTPGDRRQERIRTMYRGEV